MNYSHHCKTNRLAKNYSIDEALEIIANPPSDTLNKIDLLRKKEKGDPEYTALKSTLPCYYFNAVFENTDTHLKKFSDYVYFDLDEAVEEEKLKYLKNKEYIYAIWTSAGGKGLGILARVGSINSIDAFNLTYKAIKDDLNVDVDKCSNYNRKTILSYDKNIFINVDADKFDYFYHTSNKNIVSKIDKPHTKDTTVKVRGIKIIPYKANDTFLSEIKLQTLDDSFKDEAYKVYPEGKGYRRCWIPSIIKVGHRHSTFVRLAQDIKFNNTDINFYSVVGYLNKINLSKCEKPISKEEIESICKWVFGLKEINSTNKKIWYNPTHKMTLSEKCSIAAKETALLKKQNTTDKIQMAIEELREECIKVTNKNISERTGISIPTIKRYINRDKSFK